MDKLIRPISRRLRISDSVSVQQNIDQSRGFEASVPYDVRMFLYRPFFSKTRLGRVVIEDDRELARKRSQQIISQVVKMPEEQVDEFAIYGTPEDVLRQKELFEEAGIQYLIVNLNPSKGLEALNNFAEIIKKS